MATTYACPVCRWGLPRPHIDWEICACCGTEFGYEDAGHTHEELRAKWIAHGCCWWDESEPPPPGWDAVRQLGEQD